VLIQKQREQFVVVVVAVGQTAFIPKKPTKNNKY
jgi:hypothetical protein